MIFFFIFINVGPYRSKNFKTLLLQFSSDLSQTYDKSGSHGGIKSNKCFGNLPKITNFMALWLLWHYFSYMINKAVIRACKVINVFVICQKWKILWHLKFNMEFNGKILKCAISWKRLIVERNGWKFGTRGVVYCICKVPVLFSSAWLCQQGSWYGTLVRRPWSVCPSIRLSVVHVAIISEPYARISFKFHL